MSLNRFTKRFHFEWELNNKINNIINDINEMKVRFRVQSNLSPQLISRLTSGVLITSSGASTRIEGSLLSDIQVKELFGKHKIQKFKSRDEEEVVGYIELLSIVFENWDSIVFNEATVKQFHTILLKYSSKDSRHKGNYKFGSNRVEARDADGELIGIVFDPTPPHLVQPEMHDLLEYTITELAKKEIPPLLIISNFIFEFLAIHPFQDGNGRSSRILTNLLMLQAGYDFAPFASHERIIEQNKEEYYNVLNTVQRTWKTENEDISTWVLFFLNVIKKQVQIAVELIEKKEDMELILSEKQFKVFEFINSNVEPVSRGQIEAKTEVPVETIKKTLTKLIKLDKIVQIGIGRGARYRVVDKTQEN